MHALPFNCFLVEREPNGALRRGIVERSINDLPPGDVLIRVRYSSLNFKDSLAAQGHPGVARSLPHVPGIDAAGEVVGSGSTRFALGDEVIVTSFGLGENRWGGWSEYVRVPADWVIRRPVNLSLHEAMRLGTAGLTAAQCVTAIQKHGVGPEAGEVIVTGSTGGVGCLAIKLLAKLGYQVVAVTGKLDHEPLLRQWGAKRVMGRDEVFSDSNKPLLSARWIAAIDTVGGKMLSTVLRETHNYGIVTACGMVGGVELPLTVYPFILRGVTLAGISQQNLPMTPRVELWERLSTVWRLPGLESISKTIRFPEIEDHVQMIQNGQITGRVVIDLTSG